MGDARQQEAPMPGKEEKKNPWVDSRAIVMEYNLGTFTMEFTS